MLDAISHESFAHTVADRRLNLSAHLQELRAKGQLPALRGQGRFHDDSKEIACEVIINDAPPPIRYNLTKRSVQDDIQRRTNTIVVIKGRYQATGTPPDDQEGPLRLRIMSGNVGPVSHPFLPFFYKLLHFSLDITFPCIRGLKLTRL